MNSGVGIYHYNSDQNMVEEKVFIPGTESYEFLKDDLGILSYVNKDNQLFLVMAKDLYQINIDEAVIRCWQRGSTEIILWFPIPIAMQPGSYPREKMQGRYR